MDEELDWMNDGEETTEPDGFIEYDDGEQPGTPTDAPQEDRRAADASAGGTDTPTAPAAEDAGAAAEQAAEAADTESFELVYNGEKHTRTRAEVIALAQKGMNYEKAVERAQQAGAADSQLLERLEQLSGKSRTELVEYLENQVTANEVAALTESGMPEANAKELVMLRRQQTAETRRKEAQTRADEAQRAEQARWTDFVKAYPAEAEAYNKNGLPEAFRKALDAGMSPVAAQMAVENEALKSEKAKLEASLAALQQAKKNESAPGAVGGYGAKTDEDEYSRIFYED